MQVKNVGTDPYIIVNEDSRNPTLVRLTEYRGELRVDVRQIWSPNGDEDFVMTKKGAAFPVEDLDDVIEFLLSAREFVEGKEV